MRVNTRYINSTRGTSSGSGCTAGGVYVPRIYMHPQDQDVLLVEFMYLVFTCMPGECYHRRLWSFSLYLCYVFRALINSLGRGICMSTLGLVLFQRSDEHSNTIWLLAETYMSRMKWWTHYGTVWGRHNVGYTLISCSLIQLRFDAYSRRMHRKVYWCHRLGVKVGVCWLPHPSLCFCTERPLSEPDSCSEWVLVDYNMLFWCVYV